MNISKIIKNMIDYSNRNRHDINHFMKVYAYAKMIGECEGLDESAQRVLEVAAIVHDIACPLCREKYGNAGGKLQEQEGPALAVEFLRDSGLSKEQIDRIAYLIATIILFKILMAWTIRSSSRRTILSMRMKASIPGKILKIC